MSRSRGARPPDVDPGAARLCFRGDAPRRNRAFYRRQHPDYARCAVLPGRSCRAPYASAPVPTSGRHAYGVLLTDRGLGLAAPANRSFGAARFAARSASAFRLTLGIGGICMIELILLERVEKLGQMGQ